MKKQVFIIHGWSYNFDKWLDIRKILESKDIMPVFLKVPGLTEPSNKAWDIGGYEKWLGEQLAGYDKPVLVGHSNGGRIALSYIQHNPGRVGQLILIDSAGIPHDHQTRARAKLKVLRGISRAGKVFGPARPLKKAFYKVIGAQDYFNAPPNMKITMQNMLDADKNIKLDAIKLPVTIIWGREDTITPLSDGQNLQAGISGSQLVIINGARHAPQASHPSEVASIIVDRLKG